LRRADEGPSFLEFAQSFLAERWRSTAARTRETDAYALVSLASALVRPDASERPGEDAIRATLRTFALLPHERRQELPEELVPVLAWLEKSSVLLEDLSGRETLRRALDAITFNRDGRDAAPHTVRRRRETLHSLLEMAVERELLPVNPLAGSKWKSPKVVSAVDPRSVVNPAQAVALLEAVSNVGRTRGRMLHGAFACMYYAALRPEEVAGLRSQDCYLPELGWGLLYVEVARPQAVRRWSNAGRVRESRSLKHRAVGEVREVPIPAVLVEILRGHMAEFGVSPDDRLFHTATGGHFSSSAYSTVWQQARRAALPPASADSKLAARPYDLRHAALSLWLSAGLSPAEVAQRAGHSVDVLLRVYARCVDGRRELGNQQISEALKLPSESPERP
jgi:integrase